MQCALLNYMTRNCNLRKPQLHFSNVALHFIFQSFPARAELRTSISRVGGDPHSGSPPTRLMLVLGSALHIENQRKQNLTHILAHCLAPNAPTKLIQALHNAQLLISQGSYCVQVTLHILRHGLQHGCKLRTCPIFVHETNWRGAGRI